MTDLTIEIDESLYHFLYSDLCTAIIYIYLFISLSLSSLSFLRGLLQSSNSKLYWQPKTGERAGTDKIKNY